MIKYITLIVALLIMALSCTQKGAPPTASSLKGRPIDMKDEQNDVWIAQKYALKLGVKPEVIAKNVRLYQYLNSWENAPCTKEQEKEENADEKTFDPSWFYEKTMQEVFNIKTKPAKEFAELKDRSIDLFYGKNYLSEGDVVYFSSYHVDIAADRQLVKHTYDIAASGIYLTNNYFLSCNNREKKIKIINMNERWKGDTLSAPWDRHFLAAERLLQDK